MWIKRIFKELQMLYLIFGLVTLGNLAIQIPVQHWANPNTAYQVVALIFAILSLVVAVIHGIAMPLINYKYAIVFSAPRKRTLKEIGRYQWLVVLVGSIVAYVPAVALSLRSMTHLQWIGASPTAGFYFKLLMLLLLASSAAMTLATAVVVLYLTKPPLKATALCVAGVLALNILLLPLTSLPTQWLLPAIVGICLIPILFLRPYNHIKLETSDFR